MDAQLKYECEIVQLFANIGRPPRSTISDEQYNTEIALAHRLRAAIAELFAASEAVNENSGFRTINLTAVSDFMADEMPNFKGWDEAVSNARRGYIGSGLK